MTNAQPSPYSARPAPAPEPPRTYAQGRADERARWERVLRNPLAVAREVSTRAIVAYLVGKGWRSWPTGRDGVGAFRTSDEQGPAEVMLSITGEHGDHCLSRIRAAEVVADVEHRSREAVLLDWLDATEARRG